jgi:hypothetical protein
VRGRLALLTWLLIYLDGWYFAPEKRVLLRKSKKEKKKKLASVMMRLGKLFRKPLPTRAKEKGAAQWHRTPPALHRRLSGLP